MSLRLQLIFNSLGNIIIAYCDKDAIAMHFVNQTESNIPMDIDDQLVNCQQFDKAMFSGLNELINSTLTSHPNKINRSSLMFYILHWVNQLRPLIEQPNFLENATSKALQNQFVQFIVSMQCLLNKSKSEQIDVTYNNQTIKLTGLKGEVFGLCKSGDIIQQLLFHALKLSITAHKNDIAQYIADVFNEYQSAQGDSLLQENRQLRDENKKILNSTHEPKQVMMLGKHEERKQTSTQLVVRLPETKKKMLSSPLAFWAFKNKKNDTREETSFSDSDSNGYVSSCSEDSTASDISESNHSKASTPLNINSYRFE